MAIRFPIFMDNHSTTPVDPRVLEVMLPYFTDKFGHPASRNHPFGWEAEKAVDQAREQVARLIGARDPKEVIFTSGGTESDNLALKGVAEMYREKGDHIITTVIEHRAILDTAKRLERQGIKVTYLPVDKDGLVDPEAVRTAITAKTILISVMFANNEVGTIQPLGEIARLTRSRGIVLHADCVQSLGKIPVDLATPGLDLASFAAHKIHGPKGVGALFARKGLALEPMLVGGSHESGRRAGTENVPGILGFAKAVEIAVGDLARETERQRKLRDRLQAALAGAIDPMRVNGHPERRLPNHLSVCFPGVEAEGVILHLSSEGIAVSSGSACTSASQEPSHVLSAMGIPADIARGTIRYTLGRATREEDLHAVVSATARAVEKLRALNPMWPPAAVSEGRSV